MVVIIKRIATDSITLKLLVRYFKMCLTVESIDKIVKRVQGFKGSRRRGFKQIHLNPGTLERYDR